jgi:hypothetical protein
VVKYKIITILPFFPVFYLFFYWREDRNMNFYIDDWYEDVVLGDYSIISKEKVRLDLILGLMYGIKKLDY